jgi:GTP 3',8-cyclase
MVSFEHPAGEEVLAMLKDPHGRTIDHMRVSVTDRCGLRCVYCLPNGEPPHAPRERVLSFEEIAEVVRRLHAGYGLKRVRLTGGEPLVRPQLERLVEMIHRIGIEEITLTTNGQTLARSMEALAAAGLARVNVSLDSLDADRFYRITKGDLGRTLEGIEAVDRSGLRPVKINAVVVRENLCEVADLAAWAVDRGYELRFLELMMIGISRAEFDEMFVPTRAVRDALCERFRIEPIEAEPGAPAKRWRISGDGREGVVGFISPETEPFCSSCRRLRMTATGTLLGCIMREDGPDLRPILRAPGGVDESAFDDAVRTAVGMKPVERIRATARGMMSIGG